MFSGNIPNLNCATADLSDSVKLSLCSECLRLQLHRGIRYTVYGIWYTRIPVIETIVIKGAFTSTYTRLQCIAIRIYMETCMFVFLSAYSHD